MSATRCKWAEGNDLLIQKYHDEEWGRPIKDEQKLFELFTLELFQAGLSWSILLHKREAFRKAYEGFDLHTIASYDESQLERLMNAEGIVHSKLKIRASINNAKIIEEIQKEYGTFSAYVWHFTDGKVVRYDGHITTSKESDEMSKDLKKRGMKFAGSVTIHSFLQACGVIQSHEKQCFCYREK